MKEGFVERFRIRKSRICVSREIFIRIKERVWRKKWRIGQDGRIQKNREGRKDYIGFCIEI